MKHTLTSLFLLLTLAAHCQLSINSGVNYSHFAGPGSYGRAKAGYAGGVAYTIPLYNNFFLQHAISYESKGAFNKAEKWDFVVNSIVLEAFVGYRVGLVSFMIAPSFERVVAAGNNRFDGDGFPWRVGDWHFWNLSQAGGTVAVEFDFIGASLHVEYSHGISQVRNELIDWTGKPNYTLWRNRNEVVGVRLSVPVSTFRR